MGLRNLIAAVLLAALVVPFGAAASYAQVVDRDDLIRIRTELQQIRSDLVVARDARNEATALLRDGDPSNDAQAAIDRAAAIAEFNALIAERDALRASVYRRPVSPS